MLSNKIFRRCGVIGAGLAVVVALAVIVGLSLGGERGAQASGTGFGPCTPDSSGNPTCHYSGFSAGAGSSAVDRSTCPTGVLTNLWVNVADNVIQGNKTSWTLPTGQFAGISVYVYDSCAQAYHQYFGTADAPDLKVQGPTNGATLQATIPTADDYGRGAAGPTYTVSLTWQGVGDVTKTVDSHSVREGNILFKSRETGDDRMAQVSGTISDGTTTHTIAGMTDIMFAKQGFLVVDHV